MLLKRARISIKTRRMMLRTPEMADFLPWAELLRQSESFLKPWEPQRSPDHFTRRGFRNRVSWAARAVEQGRAMPLFLHSDRDDRLLGGITLDNIRKGPAQAGTIGYWIGAPHARQGYMREAVEAVVAHAFHD
ncbi:MAG: GNAT family protein, partial [Pseudomonadota bacterium]